MAATDVDPSKVCSVADDRPPQVCFLGTPEQLERWLREPPAGVPNLVVLPTEAFRLDVVPASLELDDAGGAEAFAVINLAASKDAIGHACAQGAREPLASRWHVVWLGEPAADRAPEVHEDVGRRVAEEIVRARARRRVEEQVSEALGVGENLAHASPQGFVVSAQVRRNADSRARFISERPHLSAADVASLATGEEDSVGAARRWQDDGEIFGVELEDEILYPAFQFVRGRPSPHLQEAIQTFRAHGASDWELALWFDSPNPWLRSAPIDALDEHPGQVVAAARRAFEVVT